MTSGVQRTVDTPTPDAHFLTEVRYKGTKVVSVSPDYAESTTSSDAWQCEIRH